jgi:hypothetical protein
VERRSEDVAGAHRRDVDVQDRYDTAYWFEHECDAGFCLTAENLSVASGECRLSTHREVAAKSRSRRLERAAAIRLGVRLAVASSR